MEQSNELNELKKEILSEIKSDKKDKKKIQWGSLTVTSILAILVVFSVVQTVQSATILDKIKGGTISSASNSSSGGSAPLPSSLDNLPDMVGGC